MGMNERGKCSGSIDNRNSSGRVGAEASGTVRVGASAATGVAPAAPTAAAAAAAGVLSALLLFSFYLNLIQLLVAFVFVYIHYFNCRHHVKYGLVELLCIK